MIDLAISLHRAPGDTTVLTGFLRDLQAAHPGRYRVWADVNHAALLLNNPHVHAAGRLEGLALPEGALRVRAEYGLGTVQQRYETVHFLSWFHRDFGWKAGVRVPVTRPTPDLHLSAAELEPPVEGRYWLFVAGGKADATVKIWSRREWQRTADLVRGMGLGVVQVGARGPGHVHFDLDGSLNLVGRTGLRDVLRLIRHADGVVCGITFAMHAAAALDRPCVVVAGGREAPHWEAYVRENPGLGGPSVAAGLKVPHRFLHTTGMLDCATPGGCWRNAVMPPDERGLVCHRPTSVGGQALPECMRIITAEKVAENIWSYYVDGTLPLPRHADRAAGELADQGTPPRRADRDDQDHRGRR